MPNVVPLVLRWAARLSAIFIAGTYAMIVGSEFFTSHSGFPNDFRDWAGILLLTTACAGMVLAWRHELSGAMLSLASLAAFGFLIPMRQMEVLMVAAIPGTLYVLDWMVRRSLGDRAAA